PAVNGDKYKLGDVTFNVLSPSCQSDDLNNMSAVIMLTYKETSFLFMGDAGKEVERQIIANQYDVNADVIKIGHHGSNTATSEDFLKEVSPSLIIIPCGKDNSYGHPHKETVDLINTYKIKYKRTDECGNIVVGSDGKKLTLETEKEAS
ncbi:MAG: MBL fold metallo-hydrolase, partial [Oscillospiraceae bacterium]